MGCLYTSWHCCIPSLRFTAHGDKVVGLADGLKALFDLLAVLGKALVLTAGRFEGQLGLFKAHGRFGGRPGPRFAG